VNLQGRAVLAQEHPAAANITPSAFLSAGPDPTAFPLSNPGLNRGATKVVSQFTNGLIGSLRETTQGEAYNARTKVQQICRRRAEDGGAA
jgi:hypothetical protein